ncbi:MAG: right-handed parallel beta-helix repeat-containing protein [Bacteroidales bacterium]|nr:right-handed parallel beta-helix repeat-containing protein [Bacteroidales bacterium]
MRNKWKNGLRGFGWAIGLTLFCTVVACREEYRSFAQGEVVLRFSQDTIRFDTVLTAQTSITKVITVRNTSEKAVSIDRVYLQGGAASRFRFNLSGDTAVWQRDVVIGGKDSLYLFVHTAIDYRDENNPFEIQDCILFEREGQKPQQVVLSAWGQDACYWVSDRKERVLYRDPLQTWQSDSLELSYFLWNEADYPIRSERPYVIYGYLTVEAGQTLRIPAGSRFYFAPNSGIWIRNGARLEVEGSLATPVLFTSVRQDGNYRNMAGQWGRIWLGGESGPHRIDHAVIRNAQSGVWLDSCTGTGGLEITNTRIENMSRHGLLARQNRVEGVNTVVSESQVNLCLSEGGSYVFTHCTFSNDYSGGAIGVYNRCLFLTNYETGENGEKKVFPLQKADFLNSIFYGRNSRQLEIDLAELAGTAAEMRFSHCLIRMEPPFSDDRFNGCVWNQVPLFIAPDSYGFGIDTLASPAVGLGNPAYAVGAAACDIVGRPRSDTATLTAGAYEFTPKDKGVFFHDGR